MNKDNSRETRAQKRACVDNVNAKIERKEENDEVSSNPDILEEIEFKDEIIEQLSIEQLVTGTTAEVKSLAKLVTGLKSKIKKLSSEVHEIRGILDDKLCKKIVTPISHGKYTLYLPLKTLEEFHAFDEKIGNSDEVRDAFGRSMMRLVQCEETITRMMNTILRYYLSHKLLMKFTPMRLHSPKLIFKDTNFCFFMLDIIIQSMHKRYPEKSPVTERKFYQTLISVFHNARRWRETLPIRKISFA